MVNKKYIALIIMSVMILAIAAFIGSYKWTSAKMESNSPTVEMKDTEKTLSNLNVFEGNDAALVRYSIEESIERIKEGMEGTFMVDNGTDINYSILIPEVSGIVDASASSDEYPLMSAISRNYIEMYRDKSGTSVIITIHAERVE